MDTMTRDRFAVARGLMRDIERAEAALDRLRGQRDDLIRELYRGGESVRSIAAALDGGVKRSYVGVLCRDVERGTAA